MQVRGFAPFQIKSEWFGGNEYCRKDFSYDAVNGQQNAKNKHKQSDNNVFTRQHQKDYKQKCNKARHGRLYGHEIEMYTVEQGEKRDKRQ